MSPGEIGFPSTSARRKRRPFKVAVSAPKETCTLVLGSLVVNDRCVLGRLTQEVDVTAVDGPSYWLPASPPPVVLTGEVITASVRSPTRICPLSANHWIFTVWVPAATLLLKK